MMTALCRRGWNAGTDARGGAVNRGRDRFGGRRWGLLAVALGLALLASQARAQAIPAGAGYLDATQQADGSWQSTEVRGLQVTAEALAALQAVGASPAARSAAADYLELEPIADSDDRARRLEVLRLEARDVSALSAELLAAADPDGGWGLTPRFVADPLDTSLALIALAADAATLSDSVLLGALQSLADAQNADGGFPCVDAGDGESEIFCTGYALLALTPYRGRYYLAPQIDAAAGFLRAQIDLSGRIGPAGPLEIIHTALGSLALAAVPAFGPEALTVIGYLEAQQQSDGSWQSDPYATALALRALPALAAVPLCGDGSLNLPSEECDGLDFGGLTCGGLGLGTGDLLCTASCTIDTGGCSGPPVCGDGTINLPTEACDGSDLGGQTCEALGLGPGDLACSGSCTFDTSGCSAPPTCGDGVINQAFEVCDGDDLGGATCQDVGFLGGDLACGDDCSFDASGCEGVPFCGDGTINQEDEECDGADFGGLTCDDLGLGGGSLGCSSSCTIQTAGCQRSGATDPSEIVLDPGSPVCSGGSETIPVSLTFPPTSVVDKVDVFLLFDDTGSFAGTVPSVRNIFSQLVDQLQTALPDISFGYGVGRFEDYGGPGTGFSRERTTGRPFTLNQPIVTPDVPDFLDLINGALQRSAPGFGGDGPESNFEGLFQAATGLGFDGNANGSTLDSGPAGAGSTQVSPGSSGDVPEFGSNVAVTSGSLGGVGFRPGALPLIIQAGDICAIAPYAAGEPIPLTITGAGGATVPSSAFGCSTSVGSGRYGLVSNSPSTSGNTVPGAIAPSGSATVPDTMAALNALGISVIGLAPGGTPIRNPVGPSGNESVMMSAVALLTGAVDDTGLPLVFNISGGSGPIRDAIVQAVTTAATRPVDVTLAVDALPAGLAFGFTPSVVPDVGPGGTAAFEVTFTGDGSVISGDFELEFVDLGTNASLGSIPVTAGCLPGVDNPDEDGDGYPADEDCDDQNPDVNPGQDEIPGNGVDDDCNPLTPDEVPQTAAVCSIFADRLSYAADDVAIFDTRTTNLDESFSLSGLAARLSLTDMGGIEVFAEQRALPTLPSGGYSEQSFVVSMTGKAAGEYLALLAVSAADQTLAMCSVAIEIEASGATGAGLLGTLFVDPPVVDAGDPSDAFYTVTNNGNETLEDLGLRIVLVDPDSSQIVAELRDTVTLAPGTTEAADQPFDTSGLLPKEYVAVLIAVLPDDFSEITLASDLLTVVNAPPDCSGASADPQELWPPNHALVAIGLGGVTDPDGDPVTFNVLSIFQDEPTDATGDGSFCPDAQGTGTATPSVRRERSGGEDGRVYHVRFVADDGRGATCEAVVTVCVPHSRKSGCVDQGPIFDSTVCD